MKPHQNLFLVGLALIAGSAAAVEFMPDNAGLYEWSYLLSFTFVGAIATALAVKDHFQEQ